MTLDERVLAKLNDHVDRSGEGCWPWTGPVAASIGYGANFHGASPHRWAYIAANGPIPAGMVVDHVCHNEAARNGDCDGGAGCMHRRCCNPAHMRLVTHGQNLAASPLTFNGRERALCSAQGCSQPRDRADGYCNTHHRRAERYGDPLEVSPRATRPTICSVDGCEVGHHANGYCAVHAARVRTHGDPHTVKQLQTSARPEVCTVESCDRPHKARGWCGSHWSRWKKHGDVLANVPIGSKVPA